MFRHILVRLNLTNTAYMLIFFREHKKEIIIGSAWGILSIFPYITMGPPPEWPLWFDILTIPHHFLSIIIREFKLGIFIEFFSYSPYLFFEVITYFLTIFLPALSGIILIFCISVFYRLFLRIVH